MIKFKLTIQTLLFSVIAFCVALAFTVLPNVKRESRLDIAYKMICIAMNEDPNCCLIIGKPNTQSSDPNITYVQICRETSRFTLPRTRNSRKWWTAIFRRRARYDGYLIIQSWTNRNQEEKDRVRDIIDTSNPSPKLPIHYFRSRFDLGQ